MEQGGPGDARECGDNGTADKGKEREAKNHERCRGLKSYGEIIEANATGIKNFVAAFEPLYSSMSDAQKKVADGVFIQRVQKHLKKK